MSSALSDSASFPERRWGRDGLPSNFDQDALWGRSSSGSGSSDKFSDSDSSVDRQLRRSKAAPSSDLAVACHSCHVPRSAEQKVSRRDSSCPLLTPPRQEQHRSLPCSSPSTTVMIVHVVS